MIAVRDTAAEISVDCALDGASNRSNENDDAISRTRDTHRPSTSVFFYSFLSLCTLFCLSFFPPDRLIGSREGRRLKSNRREARSARRLGRGRIKDKGGGVHAGEEIKKKPRVTLCPNASFCCYGRQPADYLSRACISVQSRSLHDEIDRPPSREREEESVIGYIWSRITARVFVFPGKKGNCEQALTIRVQPEDDHEKQPAS